MNTEVVRTEGEIKNKSPEITSSLDTKELLEHLFMSGNECLTVPNGAFPLKEDTRSLLALFSDGRFLVLGNQPLVLLHAVQGNEGHQDRHGSYILLIFGIVTVILVLADLQATGTAEHDKDDADVTDGHHQPLPAFHGTDAGNQHTGPENHFT